MSDASTISGFYPATAMPDPDWWEALWPDPTHVLTAIDVRPNIDAIDLCCGDGLFTVPLAGIARHVFAIDIDPEMLALTRRKLAAANAANCDLIEADAYDVAAVVPRAVDYVLMANTFHGVPDKLRLARNVAAVLKPNGEFAVINWHRRPREETTVLAKPRGPRADLRMEPSATAAAVDGADLILARVIELPPYHYGAVFRRT